MGWLGGAVAGCRRCDLCPLPSHTPPRPLPCRRSDLSGNGLGGRLPLRWARLQALERLQLDGNSLNGTLPAAWNVLEGLQYL